MQPNKSPEQWQAPSEQPSQAPYVPPVDDVETPQTGPVVTMSESDELAREPKQAPDTAPEMTPVRWEATEYIHREKNAVWFVGFGIIVVALIAVAVFLMQAWTFAVLIPVMAAALLVYTQRPPRVLSYTLSRQGLHINDRLYPFAEFKSFAVIHGDDEYSVMLIPTKRFKPGVSVYFPEDAGEAIVDLLAARLPMQEFHLDFVDQIIRKLRL